VKVARVEGAGTTARALRLDRARLEARMAMERGAGDEREASGGFAELDKRGTTMPWKTSSRRTS
jgi:hypothetical protein